MKRLLIALVLCAALVGVVTADTLLVYVTKDGDVQEETNADWQTIRNDVGDAVYNSRYDYLKTGLWGTSTKHTYDFGSRSGLVFNASIIPDDAILISGSVGVYVYDKQAIYGSTNLSLIDFSPWSTTSFLGGDYHNTTFNRQGSDIPYASVTTSTYNNITLTPSGLANVSKTGLTTFMLTHSVDVDNLTFAGAYTTNFSGFRIRPLGYSSGTSAPYLTITYTVPPQSLTNLTNSSPSCNSLQFNYTVPSGVGEILVWRNNTQLTNLTNSSIGVLWTGLPENTDITFSSRTCSVDGLACNATWVNMTTRTSTCPVPASVSETDWPWCADQDIFFWNASSDISGYRCMTHMPEKATQSMVTSPSFTSSAEVTLGTWATPPGSPGVSSIGPGLFRFRTYAYASSSSGITSLKFYVLNRSSSGTETNLFYGNAITEDIGGGTVPTEYLLSYARRNYTTLFAGDRLVIRVNASTDSASPRTVTMDVGGNTNASMVSISYFLCRDITSGTAIHSSGVVSHGMPIPISVIIMAVMAALFLAAIKRKE